MYRMQIKYENGDLYNNDYRSLLSVEVMLKAGLYSRFVCKDDQEIEIFITKIKEE